MTDITAIAATRLPEVDLYLRVLRRIGSALLDMTSSIAQAAEMAYVQPFYRAEGNGMPSCPDSETGRDPNW